jgi:hypothetical protein
LGPDEGFDMPPQIKVVEVEWDQLGCTKTAQQQQQQHEIPHTLISTIFKNKMSLLKD